MLDILMLALGFGFFVVAIGYTYACERLYFWRFFWTRRSTTVIFDYSLAAIVSAGLLIYLTYALLRPERF